MGDRLHKAFGQMGSTLVAMTGNGNQLVQTYNGENVVPKDSAFMFQFD